jgi:hypothetical protein
MLQLLGSVCVPLLTQMAQVLQYLQQLLFQCSLANLLQPIVQRSLVKCNSFFAPLPNVSTSSYEQSMPTALV